MIHYNVWFAFKAGVDEADGLRIVEEFLREVGSAGEVATFRLLSNMAHGTRTRLSRFHAIIEFVDEAALARAMKNQSQRGIHTGAHGRIIDVVSDFHVEVFNVLPQEARPPMQYACEI